MKTASSLNATFERVSKGIRQWDTWKLQQNEEEGIWSRMSEEDRTYNLLFNDLKELLREFKSNELAAVLSYAKNMVGE